VTSAETIGTYLGFPHVRLSITFDDGDIAATECLTGRAARLAPGDAVQAWTDEEGVLTGIVHPGWDSAPIPAVERFAELVGGEIEIDEGDEEEDGDTHVVTGQIDGKRVALALLPDGWLYLALEAPLEVGEDFLAEVRHLFDPADQLDSEVAVHGAADFVVDRDPAGDAAVALVSGLPEAARERLHQLTRYLDAPVAVEAEGLSASFVAPLFDADLWHALARELLGCWQAVDEATRR
jgi:hypothetical protein